MSFTACAMHSRLELREQLHTGTWISKLRRVKGDLWIIHFESYSMTFCRCFMTQKEQKKKKKSFYIYIHSYTDELWNDDRCSVMCEDSVFLLGSWILSSPTSDRLLMISQPQCWGGRWLNQLRMHKYTNGNKKQWRNHEPQIIVIKWWQ